jgi:hypothetical protein
LGDHDTSSQISVSEDPHGEAYLLLHINTISHGVVERVLLERYILTGCFSFNDVFGRRILGLKKEYEDGTYKKKDQNIEPPRPVEIMNVFGL